jgi:hypothetical protein
MTGIKILNSNRLRSLSAIYDNWMKKYKIDGLDPSSIVTFDAKYHFETRNTVQDGFYYSSHISKNSVAVSGVKLNEAF